MKNVKISILLCCYNNSYYLKKSIPSILNQSFKNFEFIIINDGSNDDTDQLIDQLCINDQRIRYLKHDNIGLTRSLNKGIHLAKGKYIARIDADDISYKNRLELQYNFLENSDCVMVGAQRLIKDYINNKTWNDSLPLTTSEIRRTGIIKNPFFHSLVMIKKDIFEDIGKYDESFKYVQDYELWSRIIYDYNVANLDVVLSEKTVEKNSISFRKDISMERNIFSIRARYRHFKKGSYSLFSIIYFIRPLFRIVKSIPYYMKHKLYAS